MDRVVAGRRLAERLLPLRGEEVVVLGLPRGGVPVAAEVARALGAPLDVIVVRKLGAPFHSELAMGAIGEDGIRILNDEVVHGARVTEADLARAERRERAELERRSQRFRGGRPRLSLAGRTAVLVDDGIATGSTARAACEVVRRLGAARVVLAVPVAPPASAAELASVADDVVCLETPERFYSVGQWYADFSQTSDEEVVALLSADPLMHRKPADVEVVVGSSRLAGRLTVPGHAAGLVVFAHGSGSSRLSPRNRFVAEVLHEAGLGTLLFDLLTPHEEGNRANVFDIPLLGARLAGALRWVSRRAEAQGLRIGCFGASTGAAAALWAAADHALGVAAVVSRGGRPDLAGERLVDVRAPTLLVVGGRDNVVLELNRRAAQQLRCEKRLVVVPGATHLFEEPGTLEAAAEAARDWFMTHLASRGAHATTG